MRIALTGPESTGKSTLAAQIAERTGLPLIPEYARTYIGQLGRPYTYEDVEAVARKQCEETAGEGVFDTELLLTKVWFEDKYGHCPAWLEETARRNRMDLYLLTAPDLPFVPDPVRENPHRREELFARYLHEVEASGVPYAIVRGIGGARLACAMKAVEECLRRKRRPSAPGGAMHPTDNEKEKL